MSVITGLSVYYSLEETSGFRVDSYGGFDLGDNNTVTSGTGIVGTAAQFTSANSESLSQFDNAKVSIESGATSIACWFKTSDSGLIILASKWDNSAGDEYLLYLTGGNVRWRVYDTAANNVEVQSSASTYADNAWHFAVATYSDADRIPRVSVDNGTFTAGTALPASALDGSKGFYVGGSGFAAFYFNGLIDEFGLWKKELQAAEITWLYNAGAGRSYAAIVAEGATARYLLVRN